MIDPVTVSVIHGALETISVEMGFKLMRMAHSSIIRESEDFGAAIVDRHGRGLAESAQSTPLQSGPIPGYIRGITRQLAARGDVLRPGDVIMHNDPYGGASHGPDVAFVVPERVSAGIGNLRVMAFSGETADGPWVHMEIFEGSYGGRQGSDGMDAVDTLFANTRNNPVEDVESHLPLRVRRYELRDGAVGAGRWRGGLGSIREFEMLTDGGVSIEGDGHTYRPWGFAGGGDGHTATMRLMSGNTKSALPSKSPYRRVRSGDRFQCEGPAGGGYGPAMQRDPEAVRADVLDGLLSAAEARAVFGVALTEALALDHAGTAALRA